MKPYFKDTRNIFSKFGNRLCILDNEGVIKYKIPYTKEYHYFPTFICSFGLAQYHEFYNGSQPKYPFLKQANWLVDNGDGCWYHEYALPFYDFQIPWLSGLAQALALSLLLRAYQVTDDKKYLYASQNSLQVLKKRVEDGGVLFVDDDGFFWIEEYAIEPFPHVLNGFLYALISIWEYAQFFDDGSTLGFFDNCLKTVEKYLPLYDKHGFSLYDLLKKQYATKYYRDLHVFQLYHLFKHTKNPVLFEYYQRWMDHEKSFNSYFIGIKRLIQLYSEKGMKKSFVDLRRRRRWRMIC